MKDIKALSFIKSLDQKELNKLEKVLSEHKRDSLYVLGKELSAVAKNDNKELDKEKIFKKVFGKKYSVNQDYLWRNELRLLTDEIIEFLMHLSIEKQLNNNESFRHYLELKMLFEKNLTDEFEYLYQDYYHKAIQHFDFYYAYEMALLHHHIQVAHFKYDDLEKLESSQKILKDELFSAFYKDVLLRERQYQSVESYTFSRHKKMAGASLHPFSLREGTLLDLTDAETPVSKYYLLKSKWYLEENADANFAIIQQSLETLEQCKEARYYEGRSFYADEKQICLLHAGNYFMNTARPKDARPYYHELFTMLPQKPEKMFWRVFVNNYLDMLFELENFTEVVEVTDQFSEFLNRNEQLRKHTPFRKMIALVHLRQTDTIRNLLPQSFAELDTDEYCFYRSVYSILFFLENDLNSAVREANNLVNSMRTRNADDSIKLIWSFCERYFEILLRYGPFAEKKNDHLKKLSLKISENEKNINRNQPYSMVLSWVKEKVNSKVEKKRND